MNVTIDLDKMFDNCEVDDAHAVGTIVDFLKKIEETGKVDSKDIQIEKMVTEIGNPEDTQFELELEIAICQSIQNIANKLHFAAKNRIDENESMIKAIKTIQETFQGRK